jgi:ribosomal protein S13
VHNRDATDNELIREQITAIEEQITSKTEQITSKTEQITSENGTNNSQNGTNNSPVTKKTLTCQKCLKNFKSFKGLKQHQTKCKGVSNPLECHYCHHIFATQQSKFKHLKICQIREIQELVEKNCIINHNTNTQTNNNNIQNIYNINNYTTSYRNYSYNDGEIEMDGENINDFGKEDISYIDPEKMRQISLNFDFKAYIYEKHFNQEHPENHNIRENCSKSYKIWRDNKWVVETKEYVHYTIFQNTRIEMYDYSSKNLIYKSLDNNQTHQYLSDWQECVKKDPRRTNSFIDVQIKELIKQKRKNMISQYQIKNNDVPAIEDTLSKVC